MARTSIVSAVLIVAVAQAIVSAQTDAPSTDAALAAAINKETGVACRLNGGVIFGAEFRHGNDVQRAIDQLSEAKQLELLFFEDVQIDEDRLKGLPRLKNLNSLLFSKVRIERKLVDLIGKLTSLKRLQLQQCECRDEDLVGLANLRSLTWLDLTATKVKGAKFEYLQNLPLRTLTLANTSISDDSLVAIGRIQSLQDVNLYRTDIGDEGLMHLDGLYLLYNLPIIETKVTIAGQTAFMQSWRSARAKADKQGLVPKGFPTLKILDSRMTRQDPDQATTNAATKPRADDRELEKALSEQFGVDCMMNEEGQVFLVNLEDVFDLAKAVERIAEIPSIESVSIHWERERKHVEGSVIKKLGRLPKLSELDVQYCKIKDDDAAAFEELKSLKELRLDGNPITDAALLHLEPVKKLELLYLHGTRVTGKGFKHFQALPRLRNLYLSGTPITDESLEELGKVTSLQVLDMHGTKITDKGIKHLAGLYRLVNLGLSNTKTTVAGRAAFRDSYLQARDMAEKQGVLSYGHPDLVIGD